MRTPPPVDELTHFVADFFNEFGEAEKTSGRKLGRFTALSRRGRPLLRHSVTYVAS
jgi:hypothetical protein